MASGGSGVCQALSMRIRLIELTGAEILPAHDYLDGRNDWHELLMCLVFLGWWSLPFR
jgi:hypothetical protein